MPDSSGEKSVLRAVVLIAGIVSIVLGVIGLYLNAQHKGAGAVRQMQLPEFISLSQTGRANMTAQVSPQANAGTNTSDASGANGDSADSAIAAFELQQSASQVRSIAAANQPETQNQVNMVANSAASEDGIVLPTPMQQEIDVNSVINTVVDLPMEMDYAGVQIVSGVVRFYFSPQQSALCDGAKAALADAVLAAKRGRFLVVTSYRSSGTADVQKSEDLAKQRGMAIRTVLLAMGAPAERIVLLRPYDVGNMAQDDA